MSLIEVAVSTVIVGVMMTAALSAVAASAKERAAMANSATAQALGEALLAEIESVACGRGVIAANLGAPNRAAFDDVGDYAGLDDSPPKERDGTAIAGVTGFARSVGVTNVDPTTLATGAPDSGFRKVVVTVTFNRKALTTLWTVRSVNFESMSEYHE
jgi:type II secretory pathway pseudopilin PulG